jgi:hypothetical protein
MPEVVRTDPLSGRLAKLRSEIGNLDPCLLARNSGAKFRASSSEAGVFELKFWNQGIEISFPALSACIPETREPLADFSLIMLLYYLSTCDGTPPAGKWVAFSELPGGRFYSQAFQGYTGRELAKIFQNDLDGFSRAAEVLAGERGTRFGDAAFRFQALPYVPLMVTAWLGDEDFPPSFQILFDANVSHHLPTDACAVLGSSLAKRLICATERIP